MVMSILMNFVFINVIAKLKTILKFVLLLTIISVNLVNYDITATLF